MPISVCQCSLPTPSLGSAVGGRTLSPDAPPGRAPRLPARPPTGKSPERGLGPAPASCVGRPKQTWHPPAATVWGVAVSALTPKQFRTRLNVGRSRPDVADHRVGAARFDEGSEPLTGAWRQIDQQVAQLDVGDLSG